MFDKTKDRANKVKNGAQTGKDIVLTNAKGEYICACGCKRRVRKYGFYSDKCQKAAAQAMTGG